MQLDNLKGNANDERKNDFQTLWNDFVSGATVHGFSKLTGQKVKIGIWSFIILVSFSYLVYTLVLEVEKYYSYPVRTQVVVTYPTIVQFPAVTICNLCWRNGTKIGNSTQYRDYLSSLDDYSFHSRRPNWSDPWYEEKGFFNETNMRENVLNQAMDVSKFFFHCGFDNDFSLDCKKIFVPMITHEGICYTFNGNGKRKTTFGGSNYNLHLYVDINTDEHTWSSALGDGIQVLVHEPGTFPDIINEGVRIQPGTSAYAEIRKKELLFLQRPFMAFPDEYCEEAFPNWSDPSKHFSYTKKYCLHLCYTDIAQELCRCHVRSDLNITHLPACSLYQYQRCYYPIFKYVRGTETLTKKCDCKQPCHFSHYDTFLTTAKFPSSFLEKVTGIDDGYAAARMRSNGIYLRVFFKELMIEKLTQVAVYENLGDVFAKIGGQMGLFLGASIMSILEIGELGVMLISVIRRRHRNRNP